MGGFKDLDPWTCVQGCNCITIYPPITKLPKMGQRRQGLVQVDLLPCNSVSDWWHISFLIQPQTLFPIQWHTLFPIQWHTLFSIQWHTLFSIQWHTSFRIFYQSCGKPDWKQWCHSWCDNTFAIIPATIYRWGRESSEFNVLSIPLQQYNTTCWKHHGTGKMAKITLEL